MRAHEFLLTEGLVEGPIVNGRIVPRLQSGKPPSTLYRIMSRDEYNAGMKDGKFMSKDGRVHADIKPHFQYAEPGTNNVLVSIQYNDDDGWKAKWAGNKCIAITSIPIPADRVAVLASGKRNDLENQHTPVNGDTSSLDEEIIVEKNIKLENGVSVFENPTTSQLHALTNNAEYNLMRGMFLEYNSVKGDGIWTLYVWPAFSLSHGGFLGDFGAGYIYRHIDFILSNDQKNLQQATEWRSEPIYESNGFYFSLYSSEYLMSMRESIITSFSPFNQMKLVDKSEDPEMVNEINLIPDLDDSYQLDLTQNNQWFKKSKNDSKKIGKIGPLTLYYNSNSASGSTYYYLVSNNNNILGKAQITSEVRVNRHPTVTVKHIWFDPSIRGQGYGFKFYEYLLKQGNNIIADGQQTQYSQGLWKSLARKYKVCPLLDGNQLGQPVTDLSNFYSRLEPNSSTLIALAR